MDPPRLVSVIVPTKNSERFLELCLASIRGQTYDSIEIIVVDNHSSDETWEIARSQADRVLQGGPERCAQCNLGAREARGSYLYRVDADFVLHPDVVAEAVTACERGAHAVCVPNRSDPSVSFWSAVRNLERRMYDGNLLFTGARFFRRPVFEALGGFDETLVAGEDYDMNNRLRAGGYIIGFVRAEEMHLDEPRTLGEIARKSYFYGRTFGAFLSKSGTRGVVQLNPLRPAFARHWRDFIRHPVLTVGFVFMQTVKYASGAAGLVVAWFKPSDRAKRA